MPVFGLIRRGMKAEVIVQGELSGEPCGVIKLDNTEFNPVCTEVLIKLKSAIRLNAITSGKPKLPLGSLVFTGSFETYTKRSNERGSVKSLSTESIEKNRPLKELKYLALL